MLDVICCKNLPLFMFQQCKTNGSINRKKAASTLSTSHLNCVEIREGTDCVWVVHGLNKNAFKCSLLLRGGCSILSLLVELVNTHPFTIVEMHFQMNRSVV
jgi:hypothetical protein